ncbi:MAG: nucleotidyltransferase domain-containing protein [bacterium]
MENKIIIIQLLKRARFYLKFLQYLPFVRAILLNGSLASGKARRQSDIDILVVAKDGRIFTARFFVNIILIILGAKRSSNESKSHAGKFCPNHFLTSSYLKLPTNRGIDINQLCADSHASSILVCGSKDIFERFFEVNASLLEQTNIKPNIAHRELLKEYFPIHCSQIFQGCNWLMEKILGGGLGDKFESYLSKLQIRKIESDPRTQQHPSLIVYNSQEMRFHPPK